MSTIDNDFQLAVTQHRAGHLHAAEHAYSAILQVAPNHAGARHLRGVIAYQSGRYAEALDDIRRAIVLEPDVAGFHSNLGLVALALGRLDDAVGAFRQAVAMQPEVAEFHYNLGNGLKAQKRFDEAAACYHRALERKPDHADAHNNLGNTLRELKQFESALAEFDLALALRPHSAEIHNNRANALNDLCRRDEAIAACRRALAIQPGFYAALNNLGNALKEEKRLDEAIECYRQVIQLAPGFAEGHGNLGLALSDHGFLNEAVQCHRRAVELNPAAAEAHSRLGNVLMVQGRHAEGDASYRRALELDPGDATTHSSYLFWRGYLPGASLAGLAADHAAWNQIHAHPLKAAWPARYSPRDAHSPLRIGFVSGDFGRHPVGYFAIRPVEALAQAGCQIACYSARFRNDDLTSRFRAASQVWREARLLSDPSLADQIHADRIDILCDLSGHSAGNRLPVFARKPAPVQITWIGSEGTTGLEAIDYLLADQFLIPPGAESYYRETVVRLPETYVCYEPPLEAPACGPLPALTRGGVTFSSFNNLAKINASVIATWAKILNRVANSRLALKYRWLNDPTVQNRLQTEFEAHGVSGDRLEFSGWQPHAEMLARYQTIDIALDTYPFVGGATTCEALWMGVPVVTFPGETFAGRHSFSYLMNAGCPDLVARSIDDYIELAVRLAHDLPGLARLRAQLRDQMHRSPLCDAPRFAAHLLETLHALAPR